jgi:hypothetical protein
MATRDSTVHAGVDAEVNYVRNPPTTKDEKLTFVTEDEIHNTMVTLPGQTVHITNGREVATDLDREGFMLASHHSAVRDFHLIQEDPEVDQQYIDEIAAFLEGLLGAQRVRLLGGGKKRYGESATDRLAELRNAKPARYPHADNTDESALNLVNMIDTFVDDINLADYSRYALFNVWRTFTPPPQDFPLAVCDARSVDPDDEVTVTAITLERDAGEIIHDTTSFVFNPKHRWYYYPDMTIDEVIVFKQHDSDPARAVRVPHTAFTDATCPAGVPTRASVEMRALALFA